MVLKEKNEKIFWHVIDFQFTFYKVLPSYMWSMWV